MLTKRKANELDTAMKRPASKKSLAKAEHKQKAIVKRNAEEAKHVTPAFLKGIYGCVRCRGSVSGCDKCQSPYFGGDSVSVQDRNTTSGTKKSSRGTKGSENISLVWQKIAGCLLVNNHANTAMANHTGSGGKQKRLGFLWTYFSRHIFQHESKWPLTCSAALGSACCFSVLASRAIIWNPFACKGFFVWISSTALWAQLSARLLHEARPGPRQCVPNLQMTYLEAMLAAGSTAGHGPLAFALHCPRLLLSPLCKEILPASHARLSKIAKF